MEVNEWHNISLIQNTLFFRSLFVVLGLALLISIIWFIDGIKKYAYWWHKDENKEKKDNE